jgi:glycosyltransferase involved in cell wall biosynthesis
VKSQIDQFDDSIHFLVIGKCNDILVHPRFSFTGYIEDPVKYSETIANLDAVLVIEEVPTSGPLNKILEPMSLGVPVFTTPEGAIGLDHLENGQNIFIQDRSRIVRVVNGTLQEKDILTSVGSGARQMVETHYGVETNTERMVDVVRRVCSRILNG